MIDFAINLETIYPEMDFCDKIRKVRAAGFSAIEFWGWQDKNLPQVKMLCRELGMKVQAFSATGSWSLCDRESRKEYLDWARQSIQTAKELRCSNLIFFPNHFTPQGCADFRGKYSQEAMVANITVTLTMLAPELEAAEVTALLEPLCNVGADGGMAVTHTSQGADIVRAVGSPNVKLLCDVYHMQRMHGDLLEHITANLDIVPYIHLADVPGRHEPGTGEINFDFLLSKAEERGFTGTICFEYFPEGDTEAGLPAVRRICELFSCR